MPEITALGWFHTGMGIIALLTGAFALIKYKEITLQTVPSQVYLITTLITAATALGIFQRGTFGAGHVLAVMTLLALAVGTIAATTNVFRGLSRYMRALSYSATLLFHSLPAVTDGLLRLPVGDPVLTSIKDPVLRMCFLALFVVFLIGISFQFRWIYKQRN